ncbi:hypothetical protein APHAL10511_007802 [Amanita phalloides]|nr:hypothetical protein APHAL10511_007802 [Amanita phalloides]
MSPSRVIDYCVCRLSTISPNRHWALDTIVEIPQLPSSNEAYELTTTEFTGPSSTWPSLWDLMHMVQFLNQQSEEYDLIDAQCYWYADMVSSLLGGWCPDTKVTRHHGWQGTKSKMLDIPVPGTIKGLVIYQRDPLVVEDKRSLLFQDIQSSTNSTMAFLEMRSGGDQAEARIKAVEERAERAEERAERAEERAERAEERAERAEERVEKAEERVEKAEEKAREAEAQTQELLKKFEARVSDSDALMARIVARLDDFKSHGLGPSIVA